MCVLCISPLSTVNLEQTPDNNESGLRPLIYKSLVPQTRCARWLDRQITHSNIYCLFPRVPAVLAAHVGNISHVLSCCCPPTSLAPIARGSDRCLWHSVRRFQMVVSQWAGRVVRERWKRNNKCLHPATAPGSWNCRRPPQVRGGMIEPLVGGTSLDGRLGSARDTTMLLSMARGSLDVCIAYDIVAVDIPQHGERV